MVNDGLGTRRVNFIFKLFNYRGIQLDVLRLLRYTGERCFVATCVVRNAEHWVDIMAKCKPTGIPHTESMVGCKPTDIRHIESMVKRKPIDIPYRQHGEV